MARLYAISVILMFACGTGISFAVTQSHQVLTSDGRAVVEILIGAPGYGEVNVWQWGSDGLVYDTHFSTLSATVSDMLVADIDGDGYLETVLAGSYSPPEYDNGVIEIIENETGMRETVFACAHPKVQSGLILSIAAGDLDNDDGTDLEILTGTSAGEVSVWKRIAGTYRAIFNVTLPSSSCIVAAGDLDEDNDSELVMTYGWNSVGVKVYEHAGGTWSNTATYTDFPGNYMGISNCEIADVDNDGVNEIILARIIEHVRVLHYAGGTITMEWQSSIGTGDAQRFTTGDATNDGLIDIVVADSINEMVYMFETVGGQIVNTFNITEEASLGGGGNGMALGDIDLDGENEFVVAGNSFFYIFRNDTLLGEYIQGADYAEVVAIGNYDNDYVVPSTTTTTTSGASTATTTSANTTTNLAGNLPQMLIGGATVVLVVTVLVVLWKARRR